MTVWANISLWTEKLEAELESVYAENFDYKENGFAGLIIWKHFRSEHIHVVFSLIPLWNEN